MKKIDIKSLLINEKNINLLKKNENLSWNIKRLLGVDLDQSQSIRFGNMFQDFIKSIVIDAGGEVLSQKFADVYGVGETKQNKGQKDVDIWFKFNNKMYYFEAKTNMDLDSEKSKSTDTKVDAISSWMKSNYPEQEVVSGVLSCWYTKEVGLPVKVKNVFYMENIFQILDIEFSKQDYYDLMINFGKSLK
jgi:hypothetical protein